MEDEPNEETIAAMREVEHRTGNEPTYASAKELFDAMGIDLQDDNT